MQLQTPLQGRKTRQQNFHITLAFLGAQPAALLPVLKTILGRLPEPDVALVLDRIGYFNRHRIAWAGMQDVPEKLCLLQRTLMQELAQHDIASDMHASFKPHVTLARDAPAPADMSFEPIRWQANQIALVQSVTEPAGVLYRMLASRSQGSQ
jgi:2'-5' RNA ligase